MNHGAIGILFLYLASACLVLQERVRLPTDSVPYGELKSDKTIIEKGVFRDQSKDYLIKQKNQDFYLLDDGTNQGWVHVSLIYPVDKTSGKELLNLLNAKMQSVSNQLKSDKQPTKTRALMSDVFKKIDFELSIKKNQINRKQATYYQSGKQVKTPGTDYLERSEYRKVIIEQISNLDRAVAASSWNRGMPYPVSAISPTIKKEPESKPVLSSKELIPSDLWPKLTQIGMHPRNRWGK